MIVASLAHYRAPRLGEQHGVHYYFTDKASMQAQVSAGMFLEHADVHGNMYGTSLAAVARVSQEGKHCVLDIDVQGAQQVSIDLVNSAVHPSTMVSCSDNGATLATGPKFLMPEMH
eukprot:GHRR01034764.1.p1 GENE.GHRR01034764.1~~GHRR01034764.1.p1  ORF type:complete len:116 (-),score=39.51 GHRR01034764.1:193-540(-)